MRNGNGGIFKQHSSKTRTSWSSIEPNGERIMSNGRFVEPKHEFAIFIIGGNASGIHGAVEGIKGGLNITETNDAIVLFGL